MRVFWPGLAYSTPVLAGTRPRRTSALALVGAFLALMTAAWLAATPPGEGTDEPAHYIRAIGTGGGDLRGKPFRVTAEDRRRFLEGVEQREAEAASAPTGSLGVTVENLTWQARTSREFAIPAGLGFSAFGCASARPEVSAACLDAGRVSDTETLAASPYGTFQPFVYLPVGLTIRLADEPFAALRLGRALSAVLCIALLLCAVALTGPGRRPLALLGILAAVTPAVLFFAATITPSGPEIAAGACFAAALLHLRREPGRAPGAVWGAVAASGVVLAVGRSLGPLFVVFLAAAVALLPFPQSAAVALRDQRRAATLAAAAIAVALVACLVWEVAYQEHTSPGLGDLLDELGPSLSQLPILAKEFVGVFGALDTRLPLLPYAAWGLMVLTLVLVALSVAERREAVSLVLVGLSVVVLAIILSVGFRQTGFQLQTRHVLPVAVLVPLWAGEVASRHAQRITARRGRALLVGFAIVAAGVHAFAWFFAARRFAVGTDGPWVFFPDAEWDPPGGWALWFLVALAATGAYACAGLVSARALRR
jgi:hypothetical protein